MSQILSPHIESTSPSQASFNYTVDNTFSTFTKPFEIDLISPSNNNITLKKPSPRVKGFNRQFKPKLHHTVPELRNLRDEDLEDLIGERNSDDFDEE
ncbi:MAG: hypothetical protein WAM14_14795 [Candidatus Nitrosopolaris sp.]